MSTQDSKATVSTEATEGREEEMNQRTIPSEPHSLGRYKCTSVDVDRLAYEFKYTKDADGDSVLFFDGSSYWLVPLTAGVPSIKVKK